MEKDKEHKKAPKDEESEVNVDTLTSPPIDPRSLHDALSRRPYAFGKIFPPWR